MQSKALLIALGALSALFVGFLWWVYFSSAGTLPLLIPITGTLAPLAIALGLWALQRMAAKRGARKLEHAIADDGARERRDAPDTRGAEVDRLRGEFERAVKALKASKLASGSRRTSEALYRLPWYAIIGPPASGKTTVLRNSGLKFPYLPGTGDRLKGIGGTRHCDWWLTNHAILLDTAGRWSIEEAERDEWLVFLDLLKKHRGERPLNGIIAAISVAGDDATSIGSAPDDDLREIALRMRERLDEITGRLGVALPVYLLFTKCDLISGFVESFGDMSSEQRRQIWGFTAPVLQGVRRDPGAYFAQQFDVLCSELERRSVVRMGAEVDPQIIPMIYEFPAQFAALKRKLALFVDELFDASAYRETPLLRGAYFTSGTQEGAPADMLFEDMADALQVRPQHGESREEKKSYFLHDMLLRVVFEDRSLATTSEHELLRRHGQRRLITSAAFGCAALGTLLSTHACQHNLQHLASTQTAFEAHRSAHKQSEGSRAAETEPQHSGLLAGLLREIARYERGGRGLIELGLYPGDHVSPALARYYRNSVAESVVRPLLNRNHTTLLTRTQQLQVSAGTRRSTELSEGARDELRDALALHLLLTQPRESCTPKPLARKEFILDRLLALWQSAQAADAAEQATRKQLLARYLELTSLEPAEVTLAHDARSVEQARRALGDDDRIERLLARVLASYRDRTRTFADLAGPSVAFESSGPVSGAFSLEAWARISSEIDAADFHENDGDWVFGCGPARQDAARAELEADAFRQAYLKRYERGWREFLRGVRARTPATALEAENMLSELVSRPGVLGKLFQSVADNTRLPVKKTAPGGNLAPQLQAAVSGALRASAERESQYGAGIVRSAAKNVASDALDQRMHDAGPAGAAGGHVEPLHAAFTGFTSFGQSDSGPSPLEHYRQKLDPVLSALKAYRQDDSKVDALATSTLAALEHTEQALRAQPDDERERLRELLVPVLAGILDLVQRGRGAQLVRAYCDAVYTPWKRELAGRFPLKPDSADPASLAAFARFFQPGSGSLWQFQHSYLTGYVSSEGGRFRFTGAQARNVLRDELLEFLQRAAAVAAAFFPEGGSGGPRMQYRVRVRGAPGYSLTSFRAGARTLQYDSGEESWTLLEWPGDQEKPGVSLAVTPYQGTGPRPLAFDNPWGLFMILQPRAGAQVLERSSKVLSVGWRPKAGQNLVKVDFASEDPRSPLASIPFGGTRSRSALFPLDAPARISQLGAGCAAATR